MKQSAILIFVVTGFLAAGCTFFGKHGNPPAAAGKSSVSITDFGAVPDGELQTAKIQAAIDACFRRGGGEVRVPAGTFRTGGIRLRSRVTLRLLRGAVLRGSRNPEDYFGYLADTVEPLDPDRLIDRKSVV